MHAPCLNAHSPKRSTAQCCGVYRGLTASAHAWPEPLEENLGCLRLRPSGPRRGRRGCRATRDILHCGTGMCAGPSPRRAPPPQPLIAWSRERRPRRTGSGRGCPRGHARQTGIRSGLFVFAATRTRSPTRRGRHLGLVRHAPPAERPVLADAPGGTSLLQMVLGRWDSVPVVALAGDDPVMAVRQTYRLPAWREARGAGSAGGL